MLLQISISCGIIDVVKNQAQDSRYRLTAANRSNPPQVAANRRDERKKQESESERETVSPLHPLS